jgi:hypothetical protein
MCLFCIAAFGNLFGGWLVKRLKNTALWYGVTEISFAVSALLLYQFAFYLQPVDSISEITVLLNNSINAMLLWHYHAFCGCIAPTFKAGICYPNRYKNQTGGLFYSENLVGILNGRAFFL